MHPELGEGLSGGEYAPLVGVSLTEARDLSEAFGARLPSEAEWIVVNMSGKDIVDWREYREFDVEGNFLDPRFADSFRWKMATDYAVVEPVPGLSAGAMFQSNDFGVFDIRGNASEWTCPKLRLTSADTRPSTVAAGGAVTKWKAGRVGALSKRAAGRLSGSSWLSDHSYSVGSYREPFDVDFRKSRADLSRFEMGLRLVVEPEMLKISR